uniref:Class F sortase n=1 Tax=Streptomyces sp. NBC_00049 TaxID=2903617 RepID=A0AAU2JTY9_9ACTN
MPRAKWLVAALTVTLLSAGIGVLQRTEGAKPAAATATTDDSLPSRALGLSGHRRLVRQLENSGEHTPGNGARSHRTDPGRLRAVTGPLRAARPLRLRIPSLDIDVPLADGIRRRDAHRTHGAAVWDLSRPAPGTAGTALITGAGPRLGELRRGRTVEIPRTDGRTAVFTVVRVSAGGATPAEDPSGRPQLRLAGGETTVLARLTGQRRTR